LKLRQPSSNTTNTTNTTIITTVVSALPNVTTLNTTIVNNSGIFNNVQISNGTVALIPFPSVFGKIIADQNSLPLYMYDADSDNGKSVCYGDCAALWPPLLANGNPISVAGELDTSHVHTIQRTDGTNQIIYNGRPLYYYSKDNGTYPNGQGIKDNNGTWWLLKEDGTSDETTSPNSASTVRSDAEDVRDAEQKDVDDNRNNLSSNPTNSNAALTQIADTLAVAAADSVLNASAPVNTPIIITPNVTTTTTTS